MGTGEGPMNLQAKPGGEKWLWKGASPASELCFPGQLPTTLRFLPRQGPAKEILLALPITPYTFFTLLRFFIFSPPRPPALPKVLMWNLPGAAGGAQRPQEPGVWLGSPVLEDPGKYFAQP